MDAHYATIMAQLLKDLKFPKNKAEIIQFILQNRSPSISRTQTTDVLGLIQQVQEREYKTAADLTDAVSLLRELT